MTRNMYIAAVFAFATVLTQANQCANGGAGCTDDSVPQNILSMLQTNLKTNILNNGGQEDNSNEQIAELMAQEKDAMASEDFVAAQNLKTEINALQSKATALQTPNGSDALHVRTTSQYGNLLRTQGPSAMLTELEQQVGSGASPAYVVVSEIKTLVLDMLPELQSLQDDARNFTHEYYQIQRCNEDFREEAARIESSSQKLVDDERVNHATCRDTEQSLHAHNLSHADSFCVQLGTFLHATVEEGHLQLYPGTRQASVDYLRTAHNSHMCNADVLALDANCTTQEEALETQSNKCRQAQEAFELGFCSWKAEVESNCKVLDRCHSEALDDYRDHLAKTLSSMEKWNMEIAALDKILCFCNVWLQEMDGGDNRSQVNASHFTVCKARTHTPVPLNQTQMQERIPVKDVCPLASVAIHPGTSSFTTQEYDSFIDFVEPVVACLQATTAAPTTAVPTTTMQVALAPVFEWLHEHDFGDGGTCLQNAEGSAANLPTSGAYTIEAEINPLSTVGEGGIVGWGAYNSGSKTVNALRMNGPDKIFNYWWGGDMRVTLGSSIADGQFHKVVVTYDGSTRKMFLDNVLIETDMPVGYSAADKSTFCIGRTWAAEYFHGKIRNVRIWNYAVTQAR